MLAAPLVIVAVGGIAACGAADPKIVMGAATTTSPSIPLGLGTTTTGATTTSIPVLGLPTITTVPPTTPGPPEATLVRTQ
jgi:type IV secretory pathway protease TraF